MSFFGGTRFFLSVKKTVTNLQDVCADSQRSAERQGTLDGEIWGLQLGGSSKVGVHHKNLVTVVTCENRAPKKRLTGHINLGDGFGFLHFFRVVSGDYGKP